MTTPSAPDDPTGGLTRDDKIAIIFTSIAVVCLVVLGLVLFYIRRSSHRHTERLRKELEKERERRRFEMENHRRRLMKGNSQNYPSNVLGGELFAITQGAVNLPSTHEPSSGRSERASNMCMDAKDRETAVG
ncbi:uncharacterized protein [Diadema antillarum]|uniref:uncharacterized protein n=1 Tax=Diadema antillarum TaxID=105358 RepID=UPI003A871A19